MCTVTWQTQPGGYRLLFNRDEKHSRPPALPPQRIERDGWVALMPIDAKAGGSWLSVNARGLSFCLINNYGAEQVAHSDRAPSHGRLAAELVQAETPEQARALLLGMQPESFNPFDFFIFDALGNPRQISWDGRAIIESVPALPYAFSAGFDTPGVTRVRGALHDQWLAEGRDLLDYHRSHLPQRGSHSVCMHRQDAGTQSLSAVQVTVDQVCFTYWPGPPCVTQALPTLTLARTTR